MLGRGRARHAPPTNDCHAAPNIRISWVLPGALKSRRSALAGAWFAPRRSRRVWIDMDPWLRQLLA
jgi:hypothetical protein